MGIRRFMTKDIAVRREKAIGGNKIRYSTTATADGWYEEVELTSRVREGVLESRLWRFWFDVEQDIQEGDLLVDPDGKEYLVLEINKRDIGINQHLEVITGDHNA